MDGLSICIGIGYVVGAIPGEAGPRSQHRPARGAAVAAGLHLSRMRHTNRQRGAAQGHSRGACKCRAMLRLWLSVDMSDHVMRDT